MNTTGTLSIWLLCGTKLLCLSCYGRAIAFKADKLWMQWIDAYYLRRANILTVTTSNNISWILINIIKTRCLLDEFGGWDAVVENGKFSIKSVYRILQGIFEQVNWRRPICDNQASPKSKFIL